MTIASIYDQMRRETSLNLENVPFELIICAVMIWETKWIFSDSNNIFLWHESEDINKKLISEISVDFQFSFTS